MMNIWSWKKNFDFEIINFFFKLETFCNQKPTKINLKKKLSKRSFSKESIGYFKLKISRYK